MVELTFLGAADVKVGGVRLSGEAAQRRRIALLSLLADPPLRPIGRDRLMFYLWPDSDTESARRLLNSSLYVLRKALGAATVLSRGEDVELNPRGVWVDVAAFEEAAREEPARAVALYGGPFLDTLALSGAPEFEQWQEARRGELARVFEGALARMAEGEFAAGRPEEAAATWYRLAARDPYSGRAVLGLMHALAAAGNRAGALRAARAHADLLEAEFDARPDPEILRLADQLRAEPVAAPLTPSSPTALVGAADPRPAADGGEASGAARDPIPEAVPTPAVPHSPPERRGRVRRPAQRAAWLGSAAVIIAAVLVGAGVWLGTRPGPVVAVLPRMGSGADSGLDHITHGVALDIDYELGRAGRLRVMNTGSSFLFQDSMIDPREIGRRLSADLLVTVSARQALGEPTVSVQLLRTRDGHRLWHEQYNGAGAALAPADAVIAIGRVLDPRAPAHRPTSAGTRPVDPESNDLYQRARFAWSRRTPESLLEAAELLEEAVARDPNYAWAHVALADTYNMLGSYDYGVLPPATAFARARGAALRAIEIDRDLAPAQAALAQARMHHDGDLVAAEAGFRHAIRLNPGYTPASEWLAYLLIATGRMDEAHGLLLRALEYSPASALVLTDLAHYHYYARDDDRAHAYLDRALAVDPDFQRAYLLRALLFCLGDEHHRAIGLLEAMAEHRRGSDPILAALLGYARARAGDLAAAESELHWLHALREERFVPPEYLAIVHVGLGQHDRAVELIEEALAIRSNVGFYLGVEPLLVPLRGHPGFESLLAWAHRIPAGS